jgi:ribose 5-phosphate isomerase A
MTDQAHLKQAAAHCAIQYVHDGMAVGLGTGSTAQYAVREIAERVRQGLDIVCVPTSERTARLARELGIRLTTLEECEQLDITIDGADEVELKNLNAIKGLGGALLREKIVALASKSETLIVDESKVVERLGERTPVPVEVVTFGWSRTCTALAELGCQPQRRITEDGGPFLTDSGNYLIDCKFPVVDDPAYLSQQMIRITGVVEHGIFANIAGRVIIASPGGIRTVEKDGSPS